MAYWMGAILLAAIWGSLWLRMRSYRAKSSDQFDPITTPLSMAVQELVATSGGIYLAIIALTSFLKLDMPEKISLYEVTVDPLALGAITLALAQPLAVTVGKKLIGR
ncbi:MAG: hypothetical protein H6Q74_1099 [Firmicutes bacterium]|nr:hypothetical protein [Bacillota bacterium]